MSKRYWLSRPDKNNLNYFAEQIKSGYLRQGWGYDECQDLKIIKQIINKNGWKELNALQNEASPNLIMLVGDENALQIGDVVIVPNTPKWGNFYIVQITGDYQYNIDSQIGDFGHTVPCELLCFKDGINKYNKKVPAIFRSGAILNWRSRNRCLDDYSDSIEGLLISIKSGEDFADSHTIEERSDEVWECTKDDLRKKLRKSLDQQFKNAEWELLLKNVLEKFYKGSIIQHTAGRNEHGADLLIEFSNVFNVDFPWRIPIQIKNHVADETNEVLKQLEDAYNYYNQGGIVISIVLLTTAKVTKELHEEVNDLSRKIETKILINDENKLIDLLCEGLVIS